MNLPQASLNLLGGIELRDPEGQPVRQVLAQPKRLALLIFLAATPAKLHRRDTLFALFWPEADQPHARGSLNRAIYFLRQALGSTVIVTHGDEEIGIAADQLRCDIAEFELALQQGMREQALNLYRGDLAPGFQVSEALGFERWLGEERDRLRALAIDTAIELARAPDMAAEQAEYWARWAMTHAPCDERAACLRMALLDRMGDRARALGVFEELEHNLREELEVAPSPETVALAEAIRGRGIARRQVIRDYAPPVTRLTPAEVAPPAPVPAEPSSPSPARRRGPLVASGLALLALTGWLATRPPHAPDGRFLSNRWQQVTHEEGIDFEPALSPDGSQLAYVTRRSGRLVLALRSAAGDPASGVLLPALQVPGNQGLPVWSPDGEFIRFSSIRENRPEEWWEVGRLGGAPHRISLPRPLGWLAWSRDGARLVQLSSDSCFVTDRGRPGVRALVPEHRLLQPHSPAWSPDEHWIALVEANPLWPLGRNTLGAAVVLLDPETGRVVPVTDSRQLNVSPVWLNSSTLLFISDRDGLRELYAVGIGPDGPRGSPHLVPGGTGAHSVALAAGGGRLVLSRMEVRTVLRMFRLTPGRVLGLDDGTAVLSGNQVVEDHDVSPDGTALLFDSNRHGQANLYRVDLDGASEPIPLVTGPGERFFPQWSPDSREVAYYGDPGPGLWIVPAGGGTPTRLSDTAEHAIDPRWSPDGLRIAYTREGGRQPDVWLRSRETPQDPWGPPQQLTTFGCLLATWVPSGEGIVCRTRDLKALVLVSLDGRERWRRDLTALGFTRNSMVIAKDSSFYFAGIRGPDEGIWAWPVRGGTPRLVIRVNDPELDLLGHAGSMTVTGDRLVATLGHLESDIWVTDLK
jgi:Tol biopolymer transport system component/DNA-binding SARP family transcriptional activator